MSSDKILFLYQHNITALIITRTLMMEKNVAMKIISKENCQKNTQLMESIMLTVLCTYMTVMSTTEQIHQVLTDQKEIYGKD